MNADLGAHLEELYRRLDVAARLRADPVAFVHRYRNPADQEVAGVLASSLAFGRVAAFRPVLHTLFDLADAAGGPRAWVDTFDLGKDGAALRPLYYRWTRGSDLVLLVVALQRVLRRSATLEEAFGSGPDLPSALGAFIGALRGGGGDLPRGLRALLPSPADGSACKRWFMFLRWMIRPAHEGIDLGLWRRWGPADLVIPLDTHVLRIARFVGLTARKDGSLRTALEVTAALRRFDPIDPVRFDFALAHLGISGACRGRKDETVCPDCPLVPVCTAP